MGAKLFIRLLDGKQSCPKNKPTWFSWQKELANYGIMLNRMVSMTTHNAILKNRGVHISPATHPRIQNLALR